MLIPVSVFLGVLAIVVGAYWLFIVQPEQRLVESLKPHKPKSRVGRVLKPEEKLSAVGPFDTLLRRSAVAGPLQTLIEQSGLNLTVGTLLLATGCAALGGYLLAILFTHLQVIGLLAGAVLGALPIALVRRARTKRVLRFEEQFPEAIDLVARALRAGHALPTGLGMVADEMGKPVGTEFRILFDEQNFGLTLPDAMRNFARRVPVLDARFFVTAVLTQRETGGNLAEVLDNLASVIRDRFKVKRQIRVISAHGRITGWVLILLPPSLAVATLALNPSYLGTLLGDPVGIRMIEVAAVLQVLGTLVIRRIINVEY
jgi:tight adherence protein B